MNFWETLASNLREGVDVETLKGEFEAFKNEQVAGVIKNKEAILDEKKKLQTEFDNFKQQFQAFEDAGITIEKFNELQVENESLKKVSDSPEDIKEKERLFLEQGKSLKDKELQPLIDKLNKQLEMAVSDRDEYQNRYHRYRVQNEVVDTLTGLGVEYDDIWLDGFLSKSKFEYDSSADKMIIELYLPENKTTVPVEDWKKIFPNSVQGKRMIKAPVNKGGGARGGLGDPNKPISTKDAYAGMFTVPN